MEVTENRYSGIPIIYDEMLYKVTLNTPLSSSNFGGSKFAFFISSYIIGIPEYLFSVTSIPIRIEIYEDRIEVTNPGGLYGRLSMDQLGMVRSELIYVAFLVLFDMKINAC